MKLGNLVWFGLIVVLVIAVAVAYFTGNMPFLSQQSQPTSSPVPVVGGQLGSASVGSAVGFGDWGYLVTSLEKKDKLTSESKMLTPEGAFLVVHLTVTNNGNGPRSLAATDFALVDGQGRSYSVDSDASDLESAALLENSLFGAAVQPGLSRASVIVFDVSGDAKGLSLRMFQGYLDVNLGQ